MSEKRQRIAHAALQWLGVPYKFQGRDRRGVDCWGLIVGVFREGIGVEWDFDGYGKIPRTRIAFENIQRICTRISGVDVQTGDLLVMSWGGRATHFGIITEEGVVHASTFRKVVAKERIEGLWGKISGYYSPDIYRDDQAELKRIEREGAGRHRRRTA